VDHEHSSCQVALDIYGNRYMSYLMMLVQIAYGIDQANIIICFV